MHDSDARDRGNLTLLVQLFGREVLDCLARAGFDDEVAIVRAGVDRLASESGIPLSVAQRIVAVVAETRGSAPAPGAATEEEPADAPREPRRRKPVAGRSAIKKTATRPAAAARPASPDPGDPFVDDAALVTWMGFSSKTASGRLSFSVADGILDPVWRVPPAPPGGAPGATGGGGAAPPLPSSTRRTS